MTREVMSIRLSKSERTKINKLKKKMGLGSMSEYIRYLLHREYVRVFPNKIKKKVIKKKGA